MDVHRIKMSIGEKTEDGDDPNRKCNGENEIQEVRTILRIGCIYGHTLWRCRIATNNEILKVEIG